MKSLVSIIIPVFNGEKYIKESIESILSQTYKNLEIIVVNDCSTDSTSNILKGYLEKIQIITNTKNLGDPASRNRGISLAKGEFYAAMDADDISTPDRIEKQVEFLNKNPDVVLVGGQAEFIDENSKYIKTSNSPRKSQEINTVIFRTNPIIHSTAMARLDLIKKVNCYDESFTPCAADYDLWMKLIKYGKITNLENVVLKYRIHSKQATGNKYKDMLQKSLKIQKLYKKLYNHSDSITDKLYTLAYRTLLKLPQKHSYNLLSIYKFLSDIKK